MATRNPAVTRAILAGAGVVSTAALLRRMRVELTDRGRLSPLTVTWMYTTYAAHATAAAAALRYRTGLLSLPEPVRAVGGALAFGGAGLAVAGASRFAGPQQISGTRTKSLIASGVYRVSRNPQYAGLVLSLGGLALARRSGVALALTAAMATAFRWWVPVEERHLERAFGDDYLSYRAQTPRWLGLPGSRANAQ